MNIKFLRKQLKMTQADLAKACKVSLTSVRLWESEVTTPTDENYEQLRRVLKADENNGKK